MSAHQLAQFAHAAFEALGANVAVLDHTGRIVLTNRAWSLFAAENGGAARCGIGENYFDVCRGASGPASLEAQPVADGIRAVLAGTSERFELEYPCHSPEQERWFLLIVTPLRLPDFSGAVVAHTNSTRSRAAFVAARAREDTRSELGSLGRAMDAGAAPPSIAAAPPDPQSLREGLPGAFASLLERYRRLVALFTESQAVRMEEPTEAMRAFARELVGLRCNARDAVELHTAAMHMAMESLPAGVARATLNEGRVVLIRLLGLMLNDYRIGTSPMTAGRAAPPASPNPVPPDAQVTA